MHRDVQKLIAEAIGGPARIRPPTIEELQAENAQLKLEKHRLDKKLRAATSIAPDSTTGLVKLAGVASAVANSGAIDFVQLAAVRSERDELKRAVESQRQALNEAQDMGRLQKMCVMLTVPLSPVG